MREARSGYHGVGDTTLQQIRVRETMTPAMPPTAHPEEILPPTSSPGQASRGERSGYRRRSRESQRLLYVTLLAEHPAHAACRDTVTIGQPDGNLVGTRLVLRSRAVPPRGKQR